MEIKGRVHKIGNVEVIMTASGSEFKKRELVLDASRFDPLTGEKMFDNFPSFEFVQDKVALLDDLKPLQVVTVSFDLQGREYTKNGQTKYITTVRGYKIEARPVAQQADAQVQAPQPVPQGHTQQECAQQPQDIGLPF